MSRRRSSFRSLLACGGIAVVAACSGGDAQTRLRSVGHDDRALADECCGRDSTHQSRVDGVASVDSPEAAAGEITISADSARPLDRRLFGTNVPAWLGPDRLADPAFLASTAALGTTLLRFPGGSWSNGYDWLACERGVEPDCFATWGARPSDFVALMEATGLPGVWTASFSGTAEEAAAAVAFFNGDVDDDRVIGVDEEGRDWQTVGEWARLRAAGGHPDPARIELWEVGNEVYGAKPAAGSRLRAVRVGGRVDVRRHPVRRRRRRARRVPRVPRRDARRRSRHRGRRGGSARRRELGRLGRRSDRRCRRPARLLRHPQLRLRGRAGRRRRHWRSPNRPGRS